MEWGVERAVHEALRFLDDNQIYTNNSERRPYFGLSAAMKELERTTPEEDRKYGTLRLLQQFLQKRDWRLYEDKREEIEMSIMYAQEGIAQEEDLQRVHDIVLSVEQEDTQRRLDKIIKEYDLKPIAVNGREIFLYETKDFYEAIKSSEEDIKKACDEYAQEEGKLKEREICASPLEGILLDSQHNKNSTKDQLFNEKRYVEQITEQYLDAIFAHSVLTAIAYEETNTQEHTDINMEFVRDAFTLSFYRQNSLDFPIIERSLRLQIKLNPELGFWLDEQQNGLNKLLHKKLREKKMDAQTVEELMSKKDLIKDETIPQNTYVQGMPTTIPQSTQTH